MARTKTKDASACVLGHQMSKAYLGNEVDADACGADAPSPQEAARNLANQRWQKSLRIQARQLRGGDAASVIAEARKTNPSPLPTSSLRQLAIAARLARGEF